MNYTYNSQGDIKFFGCPIVFIRRLYPSKFSVGEVVYILRKARLGILEKVAIKKVNLNLKTNEPIFIYKDTFNSLHNEEDLCRYIEAQQEIDSFREYFENLIMSFRGCGISEYLINNNNSDDVLAALKHIKNLIKGLKSDNFKTKYIDVDIDAKDIIKNIDYILLDGGKP